MFFLFNFFMVNFFLSIFTIIHYTFDKNYNLDETLISLRLHLHFFSSANFSSNTKHFSLFISCTDVIHVSNKHIQCFMCERCVYNNNIALITCFLHYICMRYRINLQLNRLHFFCVLIIIIIILCV